VTIDTQPDASPAARRQIPHDLAAEESIVGAMLLSSDAVTVAIDVCSAGDFYKPAHGHIFEAIRTLTGRGVPIDAVTVADELQRSGLLDVIGDPAIFISLQANTPSIANARHYAEIVARHASHRRVIEAGHAIVAAGHQGDPDAAHSAARVLLADAPAGSDDRPSRMVDGAEFVTSDAELEPIWGRGDEILLARGESLMIVGPTGVGKTTLGHQLAIHRLGLRTGPLLGLPVAVDPDAVVLYLAMDRPKQAARSLHRMVGDNQLDELSCRLVVWQGPPERDLARHPEDLLAMARRAHAGTIIVDSLKDAAIGLADDEVGAGWNRAVQTCLAEGIDVIVLHHQRKAQQGSRPKAIDDVYGSTWITAGAGSVILLWGSPGDSVVELVHLKQPVGPVGPLQIEHDHQSGTSTVVDGFDLLRALRSAPGGLTAPDVARQWFTTAEADNNQRRRAKRALDALVDKGLAYRKEPTKGGFGGADAATYFATTDRDGEP
jgi:replicative DNA helicase